MHRFARLLVVALAGGATVLLSGIAAPAAASVAAKRSGPPTTVAPVAAPWRRPVDGPVVARFRFDAARPFVAGARRGVDLRASPGGVVVAPCSGRVAYAGAVPGRGLGVALRCGRLTATVLGLGVLDVRRGARLRAGARLGAAARRRLRLGARVTRLPLGYLDPLRLLGPDAGEGGEGEAPPPLAPVRRAPVPPPLAPRPAAVPRRAAVPRPAAVPRRAPPLAYLAIAMLAAATGAGALARHRRVRGARPFAAREWGVSRE